MAEMLGGVELLVSGAWLPGVDNLVSALVVTLLALGFQVIGAAAGGRDRLPAVDILVGWGCAAAIQTLVGVMTPLSLGYLNAAFPFVVAGAWWWARRSGASLGLGEFARLWALAAPFILIACSMAPSQWDELSHWLPNARYLLAFDRFPGLAAPNLDSAHAGYPQAMPLVLYGVGSVLSRLGIDGWPTGAAPVFNIILLTTAARLVLAVVGGDGKNARVSRAAAALLGVTILCPTFVPKTVLSAYADSGTAVVIAGAGVSLWANVTSSGPIAVGRRLQLAAVLSLGVLLKEDNIAPLAALLAAGVLWEWRTRGAFIPAMIRLGIAGIPMLALAAIWHGFAAREIPGGQMSLRPPALWAWEIVPSMAAACLKVFAAKGGYALVSLGLVGVGATRFARPRGPVDGAGALAFLAGATFLGYNLFLAIAYVSVFDPAEGVVAVSFWRYNTHLGLLGVSAAVGLLAAWGWSMPRRARVPVVLAALLFPPLGIGAFRFDLRPDIAAMSAAAAEIAAILPPDARIVVVDYRDNGGECELMHFALKTRTKIVACVAMGPRDLPLAPALVSANHLWVNGWFPAVTEAVGREFDDRRAHLLRRDPNGWEEIRAWPLVPQKK